KVVAIVGTGALLLAAVMGAAAWMVEHALFGAFGLGGRFGRALSVLAGVGAGVVVYSGLALLLKAPEAEEIMALRKRRRAPVQTGPTA
ncbi:MAG TPA: hypothetical protein PLF37_01805, partial [Planctomycetota bacterium]|nr:hypothetical protein [Planctomycetota bacterium]